MSASVLHNGSNNKETEDEKIILSTGSGAQFAQGQYRQRRRHSEVRQRSQALEETDSYPPTFERSSMP
jgi:hypothetical protein